jgi:formylglycine-generating enzyme required for sulfatase activity
MAWALASSLLNGKPEPARQRLGLKLAPAALPLPIFVPLASFARHRRGLPPSAPARHSTLAHFISHHLISKQADFDLPADFFVQLLNDGRNVLLLLDGLDEVANDHERAEVRQSVDELVAGRPGMRVVVTCRTIAYRRGRTALEGDFRQITVQPLDLDQHVAPMIRQAYACIHPRDAARQAERAEGLLDGIRRLEQQRRERGGDRAETLVNSPLMVRLLLIVNENNRTLPDERADLFDKAINALLQVDYGLEEQVNTELSADWKDHREMSQHLAFQMHQQGPDQGREIEEPALRKALEQEPDFQPRIDGFLAQAHRRGSVLEERNGVFRFIHLAFQEFLVARYLREVVGGAGREAILGFLDHRLDDPWWREPILLLAGYLAANSAKPARDFLTALAVAGNTPNARFSAAELAGTGAVEWRQSGESMRSACARQILNLLDDKDAMAGSEPSLRALAGDVLAALGDPRFDPSRFNLPADDRLGFVQIPADPEFRIGTRRADAERVAKIIGGDVPQNEINDAITPTPNFYIARFPVTVAQFRSFVEATGFEPGDLDALRDPDNRPVRWVSWREAMRYCDWLSDTLRTDPALADTEPARLVRDRGWQLTLPSELEWEKAARGDLAAAVFPWGDDPDPNRANDAASEIGDTSAVGCFPANGLGLYDMTGNVWEWTRSLWGKDIGKPDFVYPYSADDSKREALDAGNDVKRFVRGGSWYGTEFGARCAYRYGNHTGNQNDLLGFRVLLRAAPVS